MRKIKCIKPTAILHGEVVVCPQNHILRTSKQTRSCSLFSSVQSLSRVQLFVTPGSAACPSPTPGAYSKLMSVELVMPSNHLILCHPLLLLSSIVPSIRVFSNESVLCIRWPKYWSFNFSISSSNEYLGLISFRMDWLNLLAVQGTLKSLLQHDHSKASILQPSAFFIVQLSHLYVTTGKTIALTRQTFVGKVMSLLFNMLSRLAIAFLPRSKHLLMSCLQSPSAVILDSPKIKLVTVSTVSPSICHKVMGPYAMILVFWMLSFKPTFSLSSFTFMKRLSSVFSKYICSLDPFFQSVAATAVINLSKTVGSLPTFQGVTSQCGARAHGRRKPLRCDVRGEGFWLLAVVCHHVVWGVTLLGCRVSSLRGMPLPIDQTRNIYSICWI